MTNVVRTTLRRGVHLLLGGVILIPYLLLGVGFVQMFLEPDVPRGPLIVLVAVTVLIGSIPPVLPAMRHLEITATRNLLDVDLPDPVADPPWETRLLGAAWYVLHLLCGGLAILTVLIVAPLAVMLIAQGFGADEGWSSTASMPIVDRIDGPLAFLAAPALVLAAFAIFALLGAGLAQLAPLLLGPSPAELMAALETQAEEFAERNRLARELHDSVGHALTVTTVQAAAARRVLETDPEFVRRALSAVEEAGRSAMEDLDHVLGVLRTGSAADAATDDPTGPQRTLADLSRLVDDTRAAGVTVDAVVEGDLDTIPPAVSREAYRIVQECLTNAMRHAGPVPVVLRVAATSDGLDLQVSNPMPSGTPRRSSRGGRGLRGIRERVRLLRGEFSAEGQAGQWRVHVRLPARGDARGGA